MHLQVYTWSSCTLKELAHILTSTLPHLLPDPAVGTRLSFRLVFPDTRSTVPRGSGRLDDEGRGRYTSKEIGSVVIAPSGNGYSNGDGAIAAADVEGDDAEKTLADSRFVIGDFVDCAIFPPLSDGSIEPRPTGMARGGGLPPYRENGYGRVRGGGYGGGRGYSGRGEYTANVPSGEWRRGERLPDASYRGGFGRGGRGRY